MGKMIGRRLHPILVRHPSRFCGGANWRERPVRGRLLDDRSDEAARVAAMRFQFMRLSPRKTTRAG